MTAVQRRITMSERFGLGRVHDGFHAALFFTGGEDGGSLFCQLVDALRSLDPSNQLPIYLTGKNRKSEK